MTELHVQRSAAAVGPRCRPHPSFSRMMRAAGALVTVSAVARVNPAVHPAGAPSPGPRLAALRGWAVAVLAGATVANTMVMAAGHAPLPFGIMLGFGSYLAASRLPRR